MSRILKLLKNCDILSAKPSFLANSEDRFKTTYGGLMSFLIILLSIIAFCFFFSNLFQNHNLIVIQNSSYSLTMNFTFNTEDKLIMFNALTTKRLTFQDQEKMFRISAMKVNYTFVTGPTGEVVQYFSLTPLNTTKCTYEIVKNYMVYIGNTPYQNFYCLTPNQTVNLENTPDNTKHYYYLNIYYSPCINSTLNNFSCFPPEVLQSTLKNFNNEIVLLNTYFDHGNFTNPVQHSLNKIYDPTTVTIFNQKYFYHQQYNYQTDEGMVLESFKKVKGIGLSSFSWASVQVSNSSFVPNSFFVNIIQLQPLITNYSRSYKKLQSVLAEIGGFINALFILSEIVSSYISKKELHYRIFQKTINLVDPERLKMNKNININKYAGINEILDSENHMKIPSESPTEGVAKSPLKRKRTLVDETTNYEQFKVLSKIISEDKLKMNIYDYLLTTCYHNYKKEHHLRDYYHFIERKTVKWLDIRNFVKMHNEVKYIKETLFPNEKKAMKILSELIFFKKKSLRDLDFNFANLKENHSNENFRKVLEIISKKIGI